jgi:archaea-specific RecJ-like exonuclease
MERRKIDPKNLINRSPSVSPFYDQIDLFRDISKYRRNMEKFGDKSPLILLLDTGSTPENLFPLQVLQSFNMECIIVDHHNPGKIIGGKSAVCEYIAFHLNPYLFGWDSQTCGGMLCYELARFVDEDFNQPLYPAVAALADRCAIPEVDLLIENCDKTEEVLVTMGRAIDYLSYHFKFDSGDAVYDEIFNNDQFVSLIGGKVEELYQSKLDSILPHLSGKEINSVWLTELDLDIFTQRGKYPTPGKVLGMVHDHLVDEKDPQPVLSLGYFLDGVIIRATHPVLPVPSLLTKLQNELPLANVDGGGHEQAGSLKFLPAYCNQVKKFIRAELKNARVDHLDLN